VKRHHAERRTRNATASAAFEVFRERSVIPVFQQIAGALKAEGYPFAVNTPAGSVRLLAEKSASDYVELKLDTSGDVPHVMVEKQRVRGGDVQMEQRAIKPGTLVEHLTEQDVLDAVVDALETLIDR
jgi:hypothetical protein